MGVALERHDMAGSGGARILIVEDDQKLARLVREYLESNGFTVSHEERGDRAPARILAEQPDLVLLDVMLPGLDGLEVCKQVRPHFRGAVLMLTARGEEVDEVVGLEIGADDYMAKPVRPRLLLARVNTLLRRVPRDEGPEEGGDREQPRRRQVGAMVVDAGNRTVQVEGRPVELTTAEFDLLWYLVQHPGEVLSRDRLYLDLRGIEYDGLDRSIDLRIARIRKKIGDDGKNPRIIKSVRGAGYLLSLVDTP
jgi:DNA-binding response OmpR family regulator